MLVRMGARLSCTLDLPLALAAVPLPALLLQPLVESSIKHPLKPRIKGGDECIRAFTGDAEYLIRTPPKDLSRRLDANSSWQVHRSRLVRASAIHTMRRDESGQLSLSLRGRKDKLGISRVYAPFFRGDVGRQLQADLGRPEQPVLASWTS